MATPDGPADDGAAGENPSPRRPVALHLPSALRNPLPVRLWSTPGLGRAEPAPLLWCHDGSGYEQHCRLTGWAAGHVAAGTLPPHRIVLADARRRRQLYSVSPRYLRSVALALDALQERYGAGPVAVMGSSLGGLTSLAVGLRDPRVGLVLTQSGSFFTRATDAQESDFRWFDRIERFVASVGRPTDGSGPEPAGRLSVVLTCGADEDNLANNRAMARALRAAGVDVEAHRLPGGHDFDSWGRALDPLWANRLRAAWSAPG